MAMTKDKQIRLGVMIGIAVVLVITMIIGIVGFVNYHHTYISIGGMDYRRDAGCLDLSGRSIDGVEKLKKLPNLERVDIRDTGLTLEQYQDLQTAMPDCEIIWSVPFQDGFCSSNMTTLRVDTISEADFAVFQHLPKLKYIKADNCTDYDVLMKLIEEYPQLQVSYTVTFSGKQTYNNTQVIYITDPNPEEIRRGLRYLPDVTTVNFKGELPEVEELIALQQEFPEILFYWEFALFGVPVNTTVEFIDLSGAKIADIGELERYLPCFYNLTHVDMVDCGVSNEKMAILRDRHPEIKIVWAVDIWGIPVRTDAKYFMPAKLHLARNGSLKDMKYCTEMAVLDFGHYHLTDVSFIEYMPNLEYLLLCEAAFTDVSVIGNCTSLVTLELFKSRITDFWPLTNLTNLRNLNLCKTPALDDEHVGAFGDPTPLLQMTWLDRLWLTWIHVSSETRVELRETLSHTEIVYYHENSSVKNGWRHSYDYYYHRDVMGMYYMT